MLDAAFISAGATVGGAVEYQIENLLRPGMNIDGIPDEIWVVVTINLDIAGKIGWEEF